MERRMDSRFREHSQTSLKAGLPYSKPPRRLGSGDDSSPSHLKADDSSALHKSYRLSGLISSSSHCSPGFSRFREHSQPPGSAAR
jgi:hypothetical protein